MSFLKERTIESFVKDIPALLNINDYSEIGLSVIRQRMEYLLDEFWRIESMGGKRQ